MKSYLLAAVAAATLAVPANAATVVTWNLWDWPSQNNTNSSAVTKTVAGGPALTVTARLWQNIAPAALTNLSQLNTAAFVRKTDGTNLSNGGLGVFGGGSDPQVDTNGTTRREAFVIETGSKIRLTSLRLNMVDVNDTIQIFGVESGTNALTSLGFAGFISGTGGNAISGATWSGGGSGLLTFTPTALAPYNKLVFTTRIGGELNTLGVTGQGYRLAAISAAIPEPASWAMMVGGFGLLGAASRRSQRAKAVLA